MGRESCWKGILLLVQEVSLFSFKPCADRRIHGGGKRERDAGRVPEEVGGEKGRDPGRLQRMRGYGAQPDVGRCHRLP